MLGSGNPKFAGSKMLEEMLPVDAAVELHPEARILIKLVDRRLA